MGQNKNRYIRWGATALLVIFISILLVVIFTNIPGFFDVLSSAGKILSPVFTGCVIAFLLNPIVRFVDGRLQPLLIRRKMKPEAARKLSRTLGIIFSLLFAGLIVYGFFAMLLPQLTQSVMGIVESADQYYESLESWVTNILEDNPTIRDYADTALEALFQFLRNWFNSGFLSDMQKVLTTLTTSVMAVVKWAANFLIGLVASVYMLSSKELFQAQSKKIVVALLKPAAADHLLELGRTAYRVFNGFVIGKIIDSAIIGVLCYLGCMILRLPYPALVATIVGVTNVIPFFGPIIGAVPCTFLILLVNPLQAFYFVIFVIVLQQLDGNVIGPKILGNTVGISGFWVLISITVATGLFGFAGMILGVPVFAVLYTVLSDLVNEALRRKEHTLTTDDYYAIAHVADVPPLTSPQAEPESESEEAHSV